MSYDLAVWEGPAPTSPTDAAAQFEKRMDAMEAALEQPGGPPGATPVIRAFVDAALNRWPALDQDSGPECPWATAPLIDEAIGDLIYFPMTFSGAEYARDVLAELAQTHGLVCYDPQIEGLLPDENATPASTIAASAYAAMARIIESQEQTSPRRRWITRLFGGN